MGRFALDNLWLIPALPLVAALAIGALGKWLKGWSHVPAILALVGSCVVSLGLVAAFSDGTAPASGVRQVLYDWISVGGFHVPFAFHVDALTAIYLSFVTGIGLLIFIYAAGYMKGDYGYFRFFAYMALFVFFMTMLVLADNFVLLYLGWEGVGLASYLLIGYYYPRPSAVAAAKKAFITNRIGDFGFAIGIFLIFLTCGSVGYAEVFALAGKEGFVSEHATAFKIIPFLLMIGAFGKSAQFPLHVWLPDAMEGPTPVSALIHAATMVTAGIYMIARCLPLFVLSPAALQTVACVGAFTAFLAASVALCQYDLKRIWAYSTLSQLGYMFLALGVLAGSAAVFHVFTHAFFKALLFLAAGSVMHAMGGELDLRKMSGLRRFMPITAGVMLVGCLALAGFPGFSGFFSKDEILHAALNAPGWMGWVLGPVGLLVALMTAYYTFRLFFRVFMGPVVLPATAGHHEPSVFAIVAEESHEAHQTAPGFHRGLGHRGSHAEAGHVSDGSPLMWLPLVVLALGAVLAGYLGVFGRATGQDHGGWFHHFLSGVPNLGPHVSAHNAEPEGGGIVVEHAARFSSATVMVLSSLLAVAGMAMAAFFHWYNRHAADILAANVRPVQRFLERKWYIDELYHALLIMPLWIGSHILSFFDRFGVDGLVFVVGNIPWLLGTSLRPTQRGLLQRYAVAMIGGLALIVLAIVYLFH